MTATVLTMAVTGTAAAAWADGDNSVELGTSITNLSVNSGTVGFSGNPALINDGWGMQRAFTSFYLPVAALTTTIDARSSAANFPAFSLFRTDGQYERATVGADTPTELTGQIHNLNSVGQARDPGII